MKKNKNDGQPQHASGKSALKTLTNIGPTIFTALLATALGFLALNRSAVPMVQDFGKMLTVGIIVSFIVAVLVLIPLLYTRDCFFTLNPQPEKKNGRKNETTGERIIATLTKRLLSLRWIILAVAVILAATGIWLDVDASVESDVETFMPQDMQELQDIHELRDIVGTTDEVAVLYHSDDVLNEETIHWLDHVTDDVQDMYAAEIVKTTSLTSALKQMNDDELPGQDDLNEAVMDIPEDQRKLVVNEYFTEGVILLGIEHLETEDLQQFIADLTVYLEGERPSESLDVTVTGKTVVDVEMVSALSGGRYEMTLWGVGLVLFGLIIVYRHPVKALIPLLPISFIVGWSGMAMYLLDLDYTPLTATLGALIIGIGTQYTILLMSRFYEERKKGMEPVQAVITANTKIGNAIVVSALTTAGGFSALLISDFVILSHFGLMTFINMLLALVSTVLVMPAILIILDRFVKTKPVQQQR